jgi:UPF0271 protein
VLASWVAEQIETLGQLASAAGTEVSYVKAHGALYNRIADDRDQALAVLTGSARLPVLGLPDSMILRLAAEAGREVVAEGFPDRGYTMGGRLVPRDQPGALVHGADEVAAHAVELAEAEAIRTVCVHGDSPDAVAVAGAVRSALIGAGYDVRSWLS